MYDEILSSIDNIDDCIMEAEMNVLTAMINEYDKAIMIMENYNGDDYSSFDIFQEGFKDEVNKPVRGVKGESILKRILMAIPRLIALLVKKVMRFFSKEKSEKVVENLSKVKNQKNKKDANGVIKDGHLKSNLKFDVIIKYLDNCYKTIRETQKTYPLHAKTVEDYNKANKEMDELYEKHNNDPFMLHKTEADVREYITSPEQQTYSIDKANDFIIRQKEAFTDDLADLNKDIIECTKEIENLKEEEKDYDTPMFGVVGDDPKQKAYYHTSIKHSELMLKFMTQMQEPLVFIAKIINEELETWDTAAKKLLAISI